jgi:hypothetical protein
VARRRLCWSPAAPFASLGERIMSLLDWPCASAAGGQASRTYYQVLDISLYEQDPKVIEEAALRCSSNVRTYQLTHESECTLRLNEIAQVLITLLDPVRRRDYDLGIAKPLSPALSERRPPGRRDTPVLPQGKSAASAPGEDTLGLLIDGRTCDVKLVYRRCALSGEDQEQLDRPLVRRSEHLAVQAEGAVD